MTGQDHNRNFTLQRQKQVVKHQDPLLGKEVLDICERVRT